MFKLKSFKSLFYLGISSLSLLVILFFFISKAYLNKTINLNNSYTERTIIVKNGDSFNGVVYRLAKDGVIKHPKFFILTSKIVKRNKLNIKLGEYVLTPELKIAQLLDNLLEGRVYYRRITFAEGLTTHTILKMIENEKSLVGEIPEGIKEGELLPETYMYTYGDTKESVVNRMQNAMKSAIDGLWESRDEKVDNLINSKEEAVILASIVEKETGIGGERGLVASVFYNRLRLRMRLQSDPTVVYAFTKGDKSLEREIRVSDLRAKNEYSTYHIYGLPPTPIANPGIDAIKAVLNPPKTKYLYFVATGTGGHNFSTNLKQHNNFVQEYRRVLRNNGQ